MAAILGIDEAVSLSKDFVAHVKGMTEGKAVLTGEYPDVYVLDHLLAPHYGEGDPPKEVVDFSLAAGVYLALALAKFWRACGLESFWVDGDLSECGIGAVLPRPGGGRAEFLLTVPSDLLAIVKEVPDPFPLTVEGSVPLRPGSPVLPKYLLGGLLTALPVAQGDWDRRPPEPGSFEEAHRQRALDAVSLSCARDVEPAAGFPQRVVEVLYGCCLWPPLGSRGNEEGQQNLEALSQEIRRAGPEHRGEIAAALEKMERGWMAEGAYLAGVALRVRDGREDPPAERLGMSVPEARDALSEAVEIVKGAWA
jgi:hypothetical protein